VFRKEYSFFYGVVFRYGGRGFYDVRGERGFYERGEKGQYDRGRRGGYMIEGGGILCEGRKGGI